MPDDAHDRRQFDVDARGTLDALAAPVVAFDADGRLRYYNDAALDLAGDAAALADAHVADVFGAVTLATLRDAVDGPSLNAVFAGADSRTPVELRVSRRSDDDGLVVVAQERAGDSQLVADPDGVIDRMTDAFFAVDRDWQFTYLNDEGRSIIEAAMVDAPEDGLVGTSIWDVIPAAVDTEFYDQYHEAMATQEPVAFESYYEPLDTWLSVHAYPSESGLSVYFRDVTERHQQEDRLRERERVLRDVHDITADTDLSFTEQVNALLDLGADVLGTDAGGLSHIQGDVYEFEAIRGDVDTQPGDTAALSATNCERTAATEQTLVMADVAADAPELTDKAGYSEWGISCYLGAPVFVDGDVYGTLCFYGKEPRREQFSEWEVTLVDLLSQWVSYGLTRRESRKRLEAQNERLEQFASIVSHDLKNPLSVLDGYLELAAETGDPDHITKCQETVDRMADLVDDLLALARAGDGVDDLQSEHLGDLAHRAWESVASGDAELTVDADATVLVDETRAVQLLTNLFQNSVEHGSTGPASQARQDAVEHGSTDDEVGVRVTVGLLDDGEGFYVEDDGPGIPEADRENVFDAGYSTNPDGTGFGLHIVAEVATAHGWGLNVTDSETGGARFEVSRVQFD
ncbi:MULTISPECIES: GAF domain-containing sensor histidine kinase [Halobacterium]|uniref:GAF domain-containing sensor histidine kinase n=1 Tax=Halobacterium TaxID=2239 RepID=UPI0009E9B0D1|nr:MULTISPECIES: ATP-binding protein [Halobacterium]MCG1003460.1 PAS domain-containing protein [Halobacterium noricense]